MTKHSIVMQSGIPRRDIEEWLLTVAVKNTAHLWVGPQWTVELGPEYTVNLGSLKLTRTQVTFSGPYKSCQTIVETFRLRFLSAGG